MLTRNYIEKICNALDCSQRIVANLLGVVPNTISNNIDRQIEDVSPRTRSSIEALYFIVVKHLATVSPQARYAIINMPVFEDLAGNSDSVVSAIAQDKYDVPTLRNIATIAWNSYKEEELKDYISIPGEAEILKENRAIA